MKITDVQCFVLLAPDHRADAWQAVAGLAPQAVRDEYLAANPLVGLTTRTTTSRADMLNEFELIARHGYAVHNE